MYVTTKCDMESFAHKARWDQGRYQGRRRRTLKVNLHLSHRDALGRAMQLSAIHLSSEFFRLIHAIFIDELAVQQKIICVAVSSTRGSDKITLFNDIQRYINQFFTWGMIPLDDFVTIGLDAVASLAAFVGWCTKIPVVHDLRTQVISILPDQKEARQLGNPFKNLASFV